MIGKKLSENGRRTLCELSLKIGTVFYIVAAGQLVISYLNPVSSAAGAIEIYSRNYSSVIVFILMGVYFKKWAFHNIRDVHSYKTMKKFTIFTFLLALACAGKAIICIHFTALHFDVINSITVYYLLEGLAWIAMTAFFSVYCFKLIFDKGDNQD